MLRIGIIGFGRMGLTHFSILNSHPDVQIVGVCDSSSFVVGNIRRYLGVEGFDDYRKMLDVQKPNAVVVATPTAGHADAVSSALERGIHVFVEKPFALATSDGDRLMSLLRQHPVVNQVGYVLRFNEVILEIRRLLLSNALGRLLCARVEMSAPQVLQKVKTGWRSKRSEGGGCLHDFASHGIDLLHYLVGAPLDVVGASLLKINSDAVEDAVFAMFKHGDGCLGTIAVNWSDPSVRKPSYKIDVLGEQGKVVADLHAFKIFFKGDPVEGFTRGWNTRYITDFAKPVRFYLRGNEFTRQLDHFVDRALGRTQESICGFADGAVTDRTIDAIARTAEEGK